MAYTRDRLSQSSVIIMNRPAVGKSGAARRGWRAWLNLVMATLADRPKMSGRCQHFVASASRPAAQQRRGVQPYLLSRAGDKGRKPKNLRRTFEGILWIFRTGAPWRGLARVLR